MIDVMAFENNDLTTYTFNQDFCPVYHFDITPEMRTDKSRLKPQTHGVNPTPTLRGGLSIDIEGAILGDDYTDYNTKRIAFVAALYGNNFVNLVSENQMGMFRIGLTGQSEHWEIPVTIDAFSAPKEATEGAYGEYKLTFYAFQPYFTGVTTPANLYRWA